MKTNDTYTFIWIEHLPRWEDGELQIHRECPRTGVTRDNEYRASSITAASCRRLLGVLLAMDGKLSTPNGVYDSIEEDRCVLEYWHRPPGAAQYFDLDWHYETELLDNDWCAAPYVLRIYPGGAFAYAA